MKKKRQNRPFSSTSLFFQHKHFSQQPMCKQASIHVSAFSALRMCTLPKVNTRLNREKYAYSSKKLSSKHKRKKRDFQVMIKSRPQCAWLMLTTIIIGILRQTKQKKIRLIFECVSRVLSQNYFRMKNVYGVCQCIAIVVWLCLTNEVGWLSSMLSITHRK